VPIAPRTSPGTTILDLKSPPSKTTSISSQTGISRELHPLPPVHVTPEQVADPTSLARTLTDMHENIRKATLSARQDPKSAPCYVRNVAFKNTSANVASISVTIPHTLSRPHTILHVTRSQGAAYNGFESNASNTHVTITTTVPPGVTALHDFTLAGD
jgi:hypothetical protein